MSSIFWPAVHLGFARRFRIAGSMLVDRHHEVEDGDILEFHI